MATNKLSKKTQEKLAAFAESEAKAGRRIPINPNYEDIDNTWIAPDERPHIGDPDVDNFGNYQPPNE